MYFKYQKGLLFSSVSILTKNIEIGDTCSLYKNEVLECSCKIKFNDTLNEKNWEIRYLFCEFCLIRE